MIAKLLLWILAAAAAFLLALALVLAAVASFCTWRARVVLGRSGALDHPAAERYRRISDACAGALPHVVLILALPATIAGLVLAGLVALLRWLAGRLVGSRAQRPPDAGSGASDSSRRGASLAGFAREVEEKLDRAGKLRAETTGGEHVATAVRDAGVGTRLVLEVEGPGKIAPGHSLAAVDKVDSTGRWLKVNGLHFDRLNGFLEGREGAPGGQEFRLLPATADNLAKVEETLRERLVAWRSLDAADPLDLET